MKRWRLWLLEVLGGVDRAVLDESRGANAELSEALQAAWVESDRERNRRALAEAELDLARRRISGEVRVVGLLLTELAGAGDRA